MQKIIPTLDDLTQQLIPMIDAGTSTYNEYVEGLRMPKEIGKERQARKEKMSAGLTKRLLITKKNRNDRRSQQIDLNNVLK